MQDRADALLGEYPVERLSMTATAQPASRKASTAWLPM
jgi:hypothetical protein